MFVQVETHAGAPIQAGETQITPLARVLRLRLPGAPGGLIWNRPVAVVTRTPDGREKVLPIQDVTRQAQLSILGMMTGLLVIVWLLYWRKKAKRKEIIL